MSLWNHGGSVPEGNSRHRRGSVSAGKDPVSWGWVGNHEKVGEVGQQVSAACARLGCVPARLSQPQGFFSASL